jgi:hypothetical protein
MKCVTLLVVGGTAVVRRFRKIISKNASNYCYGRKSQGLIAQLTLCCNTVTSDVDLLGRATFLVTVTHNYLLIDHNSWLLATLLANKNYCFIFLLQRFVRYSLPQKRCPLPFKQCARLRKVRSSQ